MIRVQNCSSSRWLWMEAPDFWPRRETPTVEDCHSGWLSRLDGTLEALCNNERKVQTAEMPCYY